ARRGSARRRSRALARQQRLRSPSYRGRPAWPRRNRDRCSKPARGRARVRGPTNPAVSRGSGSRRHPHRERTWPSLSPRGLLKKFLTPLDKWYVTWLKRIQEVSTIGIHDVGTAELEHGREVRGHHRRRDLR